jgi:hypothetical protein
MPARPLPQATPLGAEGGIDRPPERPALRVVSDPQPGAKTVIIGPDPVLMTLVARSAQVDCLLRSMLRVTVIQPAGPIADDLPDVLGRHVMCRDAIRFVPHFPFESGVHYRAVFDPRPLGHPDFSEVLTLEFSFPKEQSRLATEVVRIFPSSGSLPENLLRFYVHFSNSMQRGRCEDEIAILDSSGRPAPDVLYRSPVELWDPSMRRLTLLLDPGRLKRGVGPNRALGPPLKAGGEYTLAVGAGMRDASGRRLRETFHKRFRVTEAVREHVAVDAWKIVPPAANSRQPLVLVFPRPLDRALLAQTVTVAAATQETLDGRIVIDQCESRWRFTPTVPWTPGHYQVRVASSLEDVCGNSPISAFDRSLRTPDPAGGGADDVLYFEIEDPRKSRSSGPAAGQSQCTRHGIP